jgi:hypothetical protein
MCTLFEQNAAKRLGCRQVSTDREGRSPGATVDKRASLPVDSEMGFSTVDKCLARERPRGATPNGGSARRCRHRCRGLGGDQRAEGMLRGADVAEVAGLPPMLRMSWLWILRKRMFLLSSWHGEGEAMRDDRAHWLSACG